MLFNNIQFYPIEGLPLYSLSRCGKVYSSLRGGKILKPGINNDYRMVWLKSSSGSKWYYIHRLVATMFHPNPDNKPWVNHEDGDKSNNNDWNLKWSTIPENIKHAYDTGLKLPGQYRKGQKASQETKAKQSLAKTGQNHPKFKGSYVTPAGTFHSATQAAIANNVTHHTIKNRCLDFSWQNLGWQFIPKGRVSPAKHKQPEYFRTPEQLSFIASLKKRK